MNEDHRKVASKTMEKIVEKLADINGYIHKNNVSLMLFNKKMTELTPSFKIFFNMYYVHVIVNSLICAKMALF